MAWYLISFIWASCLTRLEVHATLCPLVLQLCTCVPRSILRLAHHMVLGWYPAGRASCHRGAILGLYVLLARAKERMRLAARQARAALVNVADTEVCTMDYARPPLGHCRPLTKTPHARAMPLHMKPSVANDKKRHASASCGARFLRLYFGQATRPHVRNAARPRCLAMAK